jgi:hypothetical protein
MSREVQSNECNELKTLKYKSMMLNGIAWPEIKTSSSTDLVNLDKFLENEKITNAAEPWSKLDKTAKIRKLILFAENYRVDNNLTELEYKELVLFFKDCLDRKKLQRVKDINYNKETGEIKEIHGLIHNRQTNHFTLKNLDKRVSTIRGLAPKKKQGTIKNVKETDDNENENENENENDIV